jgi:mannitol-1-phosphate 5-dehydrogenase
MKAVQFGAGNIGRGFMGQLLFESGYELVFIEAMQPVVDELNKRKSYTLKIVGPRPKEIFINNVSAISAMDIPAIAQALTEANLVATAVGVNILPKIALAIAKGIEKRAELNIKDPMNIIICENLIHAGTVLKGYIKEKIDPKHVPYMDSHIGFVETVIGRMMPILPDEIKKQDLLAIWGEEFAMLPVNKKGIIGEIPKIKNLIPAESFLAYEEQKLYIHNLGHSTAAYLGYLKKYDYIWQSIGDKEIREIVKKAVSETAKVIVKKHGLKEADVNAYIEDLLVRFDNKQLGDSVYRVGREPLRKLGPNDRFVGAAKLVLENGGTPEYIAEGMSAALMYDYPKDPEAVKLVELIKEKGVTGVLQEISKLDINSDLAKLILQKYERRHK